MAQTANLNLPLIDDTMTADVPRDFNALAEAVDAAVTAAVENVEVPLSDATTGARSDVAASEKAVGVVMAEAQAAKTTANAANTAATSAIALLAEKADQSALTDHGNLTTAHGATSAATASRIVMRDSAGRAKIAAPSAADDIARKDTVDNAVGTLSSLLTSAKGSAVAAINELFTNASNGKTSIAAAITGKGVPATGSDTFAVLAQKIGQIVTGKKSASGTATTNSSSRFSISGLSFRPNIVFWQSTAHPDTYGFIKDGMKWAIILYNGSTNPTIIPDQFFTISTTGVTDINAYWDSAAVNWIAYE